MGRKRGREGRLLLRTPQVISCTPLSMMSCFVSGARFFHSKSSVKSGSAAIYREGGKEGGRMMSF